MTLLETVLIVVLLLIGAATLVWVLKLLRRPRDRPSGAVDGAAGDGGDGGRHHSREREDSWDGDSGDSGGGGGGDGGGNGGD